MLNELTPTQRDLAELMSDISEHAWRAGWMMGLEYELWQELTSATNGSVPPLATQEQLERLSQLSKACGGWITFDQEREELFVVLAEWVTCYDKWRAS